MGKTSALGILCILITIMLIGYNLNTQKRLILNESEAGMVGLLGSVQADLKRALFGLEQVFLGLENYLSLCGQLHVQENRDIRNVLDELVKNNDYLVGINVVDPTGHVTHANGDFVRPNLKERNFFSVHAAGVVDGLYISPPQPSMIFDGQWTSGISTAVRLPDGALERVYLGIIDLKYFFQAYKELITEPGLTLTLLSPEGLVYSRVPDHDAHVGKPYPEFIGEKELLTQIARQRVERRTNTAGTSEVVLLSRFEDLPLIIRIAKSEQAILAPWQQTLRTLSLLGIIICLALLYFTINALIADKKQAETLKLLRIHSSLDPLTNLFNRRHFLEEAQLETKKALRNNTPVSLIMIDLDHFKEVNDRFGHQIGDLVLRECADLLKATCRETDLIGRFGGEEFVLLLPATNLRGAVAIAEKIRRTIAAHSFTDKQHDLRITASLGITQWKTDETGLDQALKRADILLYQAKNAGRNALRVEDIPGSEDEG